jgi:hypothetical protein
MEKYRRLGLAEPPLFAVPSPERVREIAARLEQCGFEVGGVK